MSHAIGAVKFEDDSILYYEYNGTSDIVMPKLRATKKEVTDNWRSWEDAPCLNKDNCQSEPVEIMTIYGFGLYWKGRACKKCMAIVDGLDPYESPEYYDGEPNWSPWTEEDLGRVN